MKKNAIKRWITLASIFVVLFTGCAYAEGITPYANEVFFSASVMINSSMKVEFDAETHYNCTSISVSSCELQKQASNGTWSSAGALTPPSTVASKASNFFAQASYGSSCTSGNTYRVKAVFKAVYNNATYTVTRYSKSVDY